MTDNSPDIKSDNREKKDSSDNLDISPSDNKNFKCQICGSEFDNRQSVRMHSLKSHRSKEAWKTGGEKKEEKETGGLTIDDLEKKEVEPPRGVKEERGKVRPGLQKRYPGRRSFSRSSSRSSKQEYENQFAKGVRRLGVNQQWLNTFLDKVRQVGFLSDEWLGHKLKAGKTGVDDGELIDEFVAWHSDLVDRCQAETEKASRDTSSFSFESGSNGSGVLQALRIFQEMQNSSNSGEDEKVGKLERKLEKEREKREKEKEKRFEAQMQRLEDKVENSKRVGMTREDLYAKLSSDVKEVGNRFLGMRGKFLGLNPSMEEIPQRGKAPKDMNKEIAERLEKENSDMVVK